MTPLNEKQKAIMECIRDSILDKGYPPSIREICDAVGMRSSSSVHAHLQKLASNGYIKLDPERARSIEILDKDYMVMPVSRRNGSDPEDMPCSEETEEMMPRRELTDVPVLGQVAAGLPILAQEHIEEYFPVPVEYAPHGQEMFFLDVKGDSMIEAGIFSGDRILVGKQETARNGEMVVALVGDEATVKTYYKEKGAFRCLV